MLAGSSLVQNQLMLVLRPLEAVLANRPYQNFQRLVRRPLFRPLLLVPPVLLVLPLVLVLPLLLLPRSRQVEDQHQVQTQTALPHSPLQRSVTRQCRHPRNRWDRQQRSG